MHAPGSILSGLVPTEPSRPPLHVAARRARMAGRDVSESHRVSTPLELLFDLAVVVAIAQAAAGLHHGIAEQHIAAGLLTFAWVFGAIWWAWMNYSWFASAYDTGDVLFRLLTFVQMGGVILLAASVDDAFADPGHLVTVPIVGYVVMRVGLVLQWLRAAAGDSAHKRTCLRYALGVLAVQAFWVTALVAGPPSWGPAFILIGFPLELAVPWWAERAGATPWHPHHIAERYSLLVIIVLGEGVLGTTTALSSTLDATGWTVDLVVVGAGALALVFALWWSYFLTPYGEILARHRDRRAFVFGYGHVVPLGALAAVGAGLVVMAEALAPEHEVPTLRATLAVAVALAVFLVSKAAIHEVLVGMDRVYIATLVMGLGIVGIAVALAASGVGLPWCLATLALAPASLVVVAEVLERRSRSGSAATTP